MFISVKGGPRQKKIMCCADAAGLIDQSFINDFSHLKLLFWYRYVRSQLSSLAVQIMSIELSAGAKCMRVLFIIFNFLFLVSPYACRMGVNSLRGRAIFAFSFCAHFAHTRGLGALTSRPPHFLPQQHNRSSVSSS